MTKAKDINWSTLLFIGIYHLALLFVLPFYLYYTPPSASLIVASTVLLIIAGISITGGYHRCFSHSTYKCHPAVEMFWLFFGGMSAQGSAIRWSFEHRLHHSFVDTDRDPYSIKKGFWYAHVLWLFTKPDRLDKKVVSDLYRKPHLVFQHEHYAACMVISNIIAVLFVGWLVGDMLGAFVMAWWVRMFFHHHFTWFINSACHYWGTQSYSDEHSAVDNYLLSIVTFGEGYHNYHHTFANDYRNGICWYHFDPTKWTIWALNKLGLASNLKQVDATRIRRQMISHDREELVARIKASLESGREKMEQRVNQLAEGLMERRAELSQLIERLRSSKHEGASRDAIRRLKEEVKLAKRRLKAELRSWRELSRQIRRSHPLPA